MTQMTHDMWACARTPVARVHARRRPSTALGMTQMTQSRAGNQAKKEGGILLEGVG